MHPPPIGHARAPFLLVNQYFDHLTARIAPSDSGGALYDLGEDLSWTLEGTGTEGSGTLARVGLSHRIGAYTVGTHTANGSMACLGVDPGATTVSNGSMTAPGAIALCSHIYRWDWWLEITSITSVNYLMGLSDTPLTGNLNAAVLNFDTNTSPNWFAVNNNGGVSTSLDTTIAATTGWHKFTGVQMPANVSGGTMGWHYYLDDVLIGVNTTNITAAPITVFSRIRNRTASTKTMSFDHCQVWSDGAAMVLGGVA